MTEAGAESAVKIPEIALESTPRDKKQHPCSAKPSNAQHEAVEQYKM
jgi:hypothetical protein